ncbi:hypothetical protein RI367_002059 [Sorochytrium milnesiophthora]
MPSPLLVRLLVASIAAGISALAAYTVYAKYAADEDDQAYFEDPSFVYSQRLRRQLRDHSHSSDADDGNAADDERQLTRTNAATLRHRHHPSHAADDSISMTSISANHPSADIDKELLRTEQELQLLIQRREALELRKNELAMSELLSLAGSEHSSAASSSAPSAARSLTPQPAGKTQPSAPPSVVSNDADIQQLIESLHLSEHELQLNMQPPVAPSYQSQPDTPSPQRDLLHADDADQPAFPQFDANESSARIDRPALEADVAVPYVHHYDGEQEDEEDDDDDSVVSAESDFTQVSYAELRGSSSNHGDDQQEEQERL